ncbi:hypothetical protein TRIUR3_20553 [Triticum urartu]|uniref:RNase H type-1 domain-containing protein n=1 Tax=Triticum urartu TaxID=4572 RepID=M7ZN62_TRIUA|nr:hypothetical protein TRIUR3_20553 [Triticum urartu]
MAALKCACDYSVVKLACTDVGYDIESLSEPVSTRRGSATRPQGRSPGASAPSGGSPTKHFHSRKGRGVRKRGLGWSRLSDACVPARWGLDGARGIARSHNSFMGAWSKPLPDVTNPLIAEAASVQGGVIFAALRGFNKVVTETDCMEVVFDNPFVNIMVSELTRKRLDTRSIIQLLRGLDAPPGTTAFIEKSSPFPTDGKLGWWSTGFSYGLWIAALVASEFSVVPVASQTWKSYFGLTRSASPKDDSRRAATILFPDKALSLKLKKHHGRAEALLLAAYGKGLVLPSEKFSKTQRVLKQETNLALTGMPD